MDTSSPPASGVVPRQPATTVPTTPAGPAAQVGPPPLPTLSAAAASISPAQTTPVPTSAKGSGRGWKDGPHYWSDTWRNPATLFQTLGSREHDARMEVRRKSEKERTARAGPGCSVNEPRPASVESVDSSGSNLPHGGAMVEAAADVSIPPASGVASILPATAASTQPGSASSPPLPARTSPAPNQQASGAA